MHTLKKYERLKSRKQIGQLFDEGKSFVLSPFRVYYHLDLPARQLQPGLQMGAGVSVKNFKKAVDRNRVKRLIREGYRLQKKALQQALSEKKMHLDLFIIYTGKELPDYNLVSDKIKSALIKLEKIIQSS